MFFAINSAKDIENVFQLVGIDKKIPLKKSGTSHVYDCAWIAKIF